MLRQAGKATGSSWNTETSDSAKISIELRKAELTFLKNENTKQNNSKRPLKTMTS